MVKKIIPFGGDFPLSRAIVHNQKYTMEVSGQIGINANTKELEEGIEKQTERIIEIIKEILECEGWSLNDIIKTTIYLADMKYYAKMNEIYSKYFAKDYPTRTALAVKELPKGALIEITCTAVNDKLSN